RSLIVAEEEQLVLDDRPACRRAELLEARIRKRLIGRVCEWIPRLLPVPAIVVKARPMKFIRTGFRLHRHYASDRLAEFRVVVLQCDFHGSGFYDYRGDGQEARNPFTNPP